MGEFLEVAKIMVQPTMKLLEMCGNAIGTVYEPRHICKLADAEAYKVKQLSAAISESNTLPIVYENGNISMNTSDINDLAKRAEYRANYQMLREQYNIESVVGKAYLELVDAPEVTSDPIDEDWITRFFSIVKDVNNEEMQYVWGKILSGEIKKPKSFSLRTLETIRNLSQSDAEIFQKIIPLVLEDEENAFILSDNDFLSEHSIRFDMLSELNECGLIATEGGMISITFEVNECKNAKLTHKTGEIVMMTKTGANASCDFGIYSLTRAGKELYKILEFTPDEEYLNKVVEKILSLRSNSKSVGFEIRKINCASTEE